MTYPVQCGKCKLAIDEAQDVGPEGRRPCPNCGSMSRIYNMFGSGGIQISGSGIIGVGTVSPPTSSFLLQAVIVPGAKVFDGNLIAAVAPAWKKIIDLLEKDPKLAFTITPRKWEEIIAGAYEEAGFDEVILTPHSGDLGRDVIATKKGYWSVRIIDQVKAYGPDHRVPANDVRALVGVLHGDQTASKGLVTTTSDFAPMIASDPFIAPFIPHRLELVNGKQLITRLTDIRDGYKA